MFVSWHNTTCNVKSNGENPTFREKHFHTFFNAKTNTTNYT